MLISKKHNFACKIWIEHEGKPLLGKGGARILEEIDSTESLSKTSRNLNMSYRYVWNYLQKIEKSIGEPVVETYRGGKIGGGGARLNNLGRSLLQEYKRTENYLEKILENEECWRMTSAKAAARNRLRGKVVSAQKVGVTAQVRVKVTLPVTVTVLLCRDAFDNLGMKVGDKAEVIIKDAEVMMAK